MNEGARLHKALADLGLGSRREIEGWIEAGRVTVNGRRAVLGQRIARGDRVAVDGKPVRLPDAAVAQIAASLAQKARRPASSTFKCCFHNSRACQNLLALVVPWKKSSSRSVWCCCSTNLKSTSSTCSR